MGKTGSIEWVRIKGRKGHVRMMPRSEVKYKRPGPAQRYAADGTKRKRIARSPKALAK
ncbi:MAG: hypothetical protein DNFNHJIP_00590 [Candidatus Argoarchaeum ethanivorans]|uniref:DUF5350 family protein n=1 Tax=Candidatus Argoarchaeum ethanivorans TaxID=2608793 RepID=A0A811T6R7_9EURY|nr:MAG: hypothetical protein AEth_01032 [Candidatus Argoarchaeum ethanivorans]CAD6491179.1 MAG: hypothetical protein FFODKBPE_00116 [Candidatus Argoarchaeum ethanivorans]CAD6491892.1 MAG: hypothetical protein EMLJLAPB_00173 [Candidatus Argoarchaeum ethanivorans]CAD7767183.1 MAG: hypothetical protein DNFNHJIP_00590 [Candidatus Argoarchaeum ethanivorans]